METKENFVRDIAVCSICILLSVLLLVYNLLRSNSYIFYSALLLLIWVITLLKKIVKMRLSGKEVDNAAAEHRRKTTIIYVVGIVVCGILTLCFYEPRSGRIWLYTGWVRGTILAAAWVAVSLWEIAKLHLPNKKETPHASDPTTEP